MASLTVEGLVIFSWLVQPESTSRESMPFASAKQMSVCRLSPTIKHLERGTSVSPWSSLINSKALVDGLPMIVGLIPVAVSRKFRIHPLPATNLVPMAMFLSVLQPMKAA